MSNIKRHNTTIIVLIALWLSGYVGVSFAHICTSHLCTSDWSISLTHHNHNHQTTEYTQESSCESDCCGSDILESEGDNNHSEHDCDCACSASNKFEGETILLSQYVAIEIPQMDLLSRVVADNYKDDINEEHNTRPPTLYSGRHILALNSVLII
ncbi:MAG: hypothetical protein ACRCZM_05435 [Bacteroidales bacterium]